jgi:hypothetical protein
MTLEAALEKRDMKASELIRRSGVSAPTIYNITSPNKAPYKTGVKADTLAKIAKVLNAIIVIDSQCSSVADVTQKIIIHVGTTARAVVL